MSQRKKHFLIQGTFHIVGYAPDGDTIRFRPANPKTWLSVFAATQNGSRTPKPVQLVRLQGIDALETHYTPAQIQTPPEWQRWNPRLLSSPELRQFSQPANLGDLAAEHLLKYLGVCRVNWDSDGDDKKIATAYYQQGPSEIPIYNEESQLPGYIITEGLDLTHRRVLGWVFAGDLPEKYYNGKRLNDDEVAELIPESVNYQMLRHGVVYPYIFMTMGEPMRHLMARAAAKAQREAAVVQHPHQAKNVWSLDRCTVGVDLPQISTLTDRYAIHPLFFRQIVNLWYQNNMDVYHNLLRTKTDQPFSYDERLDLTKFFSLRDPDVYIVSENDFTQLSDVMDIQPTQIKLRTHLHDLVFIT